MSHTSTLSKIENEVVETVLRIHPDAKPCGAKTQWPECFQVEPDGHETFWYNVRENTHIVKFLQKDNHLVHLIGGKSLLEGDN